MKNEEKYLQCIYQRIILFKLINELGRDEYINEKEAVYKIRTSH